MKLAADSDESLRDGDESWGDELPSMILPVPLEPWHEDDYQPGRFALAGLWLGALAGGMSLVANVIGSTLWPAVSGEPQHPLRLIQVYLTFPLGESALALDGGFLLALGCVLYLATGMLYGMFFELVLSYFLPRAGVTARIVACSILALAIWFVNFYGILVWLQPWALGGSWILEIVPWWVAAVTHLVFGWTMALVYPLGALSANEASKGTLS